MRKIVKKNKLQEECKELTGWDGAIYDAEQKISKTKGRLAELKAALALFKERRDAGEPFPCATSESTSELMRQEGLLRQSPGMALCLKSL